MFANWLKEYRSLTEKFQFISKLATFLISTFTILSIYDVIYFYCCDLSDAKLQFIVELKIIPAIIFQCLILSVFISRFILLFYAARKVFWFNQVLYLIGLLLISTYWFYSLPPGNGFGVYSTYSSVFIRASRSFDNAAFSYLIFSPLKCFIVILAAFVKSKRTD